MQKISNKACLIIVLVLLAIGCMVEAVEFRDLITKNNLYRVKKQSNPCQAGCTACFWEGGSSGGLNGYVTCTGPRWVYRDCGAGTYCQKSAPCSVYCG
jgi:hypothetical protein